MRKVKHRTPTAANRDISHVDQWPFVAALRQPVKRVFRFCRHVPRANEAVLSGGVTLADDFKSGLLETAFSDLNIFLHEAGVSHGGPYRISFEKAHDLSFEEYIIDIKKNDCVVKAAEIEGVRRAIFFLEDTLLAADGPGQGHSLGYVRESSGLRYYKDYDERGEEDQI